MVSGDFMNVKLISLIFIILSLFISGCAEKPVPTPTTIPTTAPTITETTTPTAIPTTAAPTPTSTPVRTPMLYKSYVDQDYGFYRVIDVSNKPTVYENLTLNIYSGDSVVWINDATPDEKLTIISDQGLWNSTAAILRWNYQQFQYNFTQPGAYSVSIREYPRKLHQKIIVKE